jgi:hypothetical protein
MRLVEYLYGLQFSQQHLFSQQVHEILADHRAIVDDP